MDARLNIQALQLDIQVDFFLKLTTTTTTKKEKNTAFPEFKRINDAQMCESQTHENTYALFNSQWLYLPFV